MPVTSILFGQPVALGEPPEPSFFSDLYLDQVFAGVAAGREQYELAPFFRTPLRDEAAVWYRHQVLKDLEDQATGTAVRQFAERMRAVRDDLAQARKLRYRYQKEAWFLSAVRGYCAAVAELAVALAQAGLVSRGLTAFRDFLSGYAASAGFASCTTLPASAIRCRPREPGCSCPTRSSPTSSGKRSWPPCAASLRTSWPASATRSRRRPAAACWS